VTFAHPAFLLLLLPLAVLAAWEIRRARGERAALRYSDGEAVAALPATLWSRLHGLPALLRLLGIALAVLALARPQERGVIVERSAEGIDIMLVLDLSSSMLARDFPPNRLEAAREVAIEFVEGRVSDRIGLVIFSGKAFTQTPLTLDYPFLIGALRDVQLGLLEDGTAIGTALATAVARLRTSEAASRVVVLLTDGHNNRGEIDPLTAAELAYLHDIRVYAIGMGSDGLDVMGRAIPEHLREMMPDDGGVDDATLRAVAERTGGRYYHAGDRAALDAVYDEISDLERSEIQETTFTHVAERYTLFLWPAFALLAGAVLLSTTRLRRVP
jgi:Ca-activated chloride channel homolog